MSRISVPPLNPLVDATPFSKITTISDLGSLLGEFVSLLKQEHYDDRAITKLDRIAKWFKVWKAEQPPYILQCYTIRDVKDIRDLIRSIVLSRWKDSDEQYLEYQQEWPFVQAVLLAMRCKGKLHPHNVFYSAMFHSVYFHGGQSLRARDLLPKCYILPSIAGLLAAREAKTNDVRTYFAFDPSSYGGRKVKKQCSTTHIHISSTANVLLGAVPQCSQQVLARHRHRKAMEKKRKQKAQNRTMNDYYQSKARNH